MPPQTYKELTAQSKKLALEAKEKIVAKMGPKKPSKQLMPKKMTKKEKKTISATVKVTPPAVPHDYAEDVIEGDLSELFGDIPNPPAGSKRNITVFRNFLPHNCKVLGYTLLSHPSHVVTSEPLLVGCVLFNGQLNKYFLRVKKISFTMQYLQSFITMDATTGQTINKISGKQLVTHSDLIQLNRDVLNHSETISELYPVFIRSQMSKKEWPKKRREVHHLRGPGGGRGGDRELRESHRFHPSEPLS